MLLLEDFVSENKINALKSKDSDKKGILNHTSHLIKASEEFLAQNDTQEQEKMKTNFDTALSLMSLSLVDNHNHTEELNKLKKELKNLMNASKTNVLYNNDNLLQNVERFSKSLKNVTQEIIEKEKTIPMLKVNPLIKLFGLVDHIQCFQRYFSSFLTNIDISKKEIIQASKDLKTDYSKNLLRTSVDQFFNNCSQAIDTLLVQLKVKEIGKVYFDLQD